MFTRLRALAEMIGAICDEPRDGADFGREDFLLFDAILNPVELGQAISLTQSPASLGSLF